MSTNEIKINLDKFDNPDTREERETHNNIQLFTNKNEEIKFFLREYRALEAEKFDFYYIVPFKWMKQWDAYISDSNGCYPEKIENSHLLDENQTIRQDLVENVDYVILPRSLGYFFHDVYQGGRRLKTKNRHIYFTCDKIQLCNKHDLKSNLKVFEYQHLLDEEKYLNIEENRKMRRDECHIFSWC